jgi:hypothetical protein
MRYFLYFYTHIQHYYSPDSEDIRCFGNALYKSETFPSLSDLEKHADESECYITGITEISEEDYNRFD